MFLLAVVVAGTGCSDDVPVVPPQGSSTGASTGDSSPPTIPLDTTAGDDTGNATGSATGDESTGTTGDSSGSADGDSTGTTGDEVIPGQTVSQIVSAGTRSVSPSFTAVFTVGQPSQLQSTHESANFTIQGGLIGANGSPP